MFEAKIEKSKSCWLWLGTIDAKGYAINPPLPLKKKYKTGRCHRISFMLAGKKIPPGRVIDHVCKIRCCVNPHHLRAVTVAQNSNFNSDGITAKNMAKTHCVRGHEFIGNNFRIRMDSGARVCRLCANETMRKRRLIKYDHH